MHGRSEDGAEPNLFGAGNLGDGTSIKTQKRLITPRSAAQARYIRLLHDQELVFGIGPAGTGKTYLAVAVAVAMLAKGTVDRIILSRPAVEAGERLGFLPGDLKEKVDPYLRPLYDALHDMMPGDQVVKRLTTGEIEVAPLAFMRGRTLANSFVILDEAQNTSPMQMKMFLTRLGENSRMAVNGDLTQIDLPPGQKSGLRDALEAIETCRRRRHGALLQSRRGAPPSGRRRSSPPTIRATARRRGLGQPAMHRAAAWAAIPATRRRTADRRPICPAHAGPTAPFHRDLHRGPELGQAGAGRRAGAAPRRARRAWPQAKSDGWKGSRVGHEISFVLTDDKRMRALNRAYRGKDKPTNVLSFAALDGARPKPGMPWLLGDVVLTSGVIAREAKAQRKNLHASPHAPGGAWRAASPGLRPRTGSRRRSHGSAGDRRACRHGHRQPL